MLHDLSKAAMALSGVARAANVARSRLCDGDTATAALSAATAIYGLNMPGH